MSNGFSADEKKAMKERAAELRAQGKKGAKQADALQAVMDAIDKLEGDDREVAERVHATVLATAPDLLPRTYYGMPAYTNDEGKNIVFLQPASKFGTRYSTIGFEHAANLDDGDVWATHFAVPRWTNNVEKLLVEKLRQAIS